ncbi:MAG: hypothetical protein LBH68_00565 [Bifidobacteriaceae bacterium]|jgi:endonuclease/exonuclease/phosphatase family metal-dependent hydrolase|nr:hypothetical protein [Bifidobacteriaceae bacterium]
MRKLLKIVGVLVLLVAVAVVGFFGVATATEFRPGATQDLPVTGEPVASPPAPGDQLSLLTFNIGYGGLGRDQDFFMDGGAMVRPPNKDDVEANLNGIMATLEANPVDVYFLQEVDSASRRSYGINEVDRITEAMAGTSAYALNFKSMFTPYPWPPIGKVTSGIVTVTGFEVLEAQRVSLQVPFKWPVRMFNLKRCLLVERVPVTGGKDLVLVNLHLEAYESGEGRAAQMNELLGLIQREYAKGNYVIAGGDFNQSFPGANFPKVSENWEPGQFDASSLAKGWTVAADTATPTSRLNDSPWNGNNQLFAIDGFIVSPNIEVTEVKTLDDDFTYSDHNPVLLKVELK